MYALRIEPRPVERIWGGRRLATEFGRVLPEAKSIGESWEVQGPLKVANGPWKGQTLDELVVERGAQFLGSRAAQHRTFPLLTKWLDCKDWLSVQVHPDDTIAARLSGDPSAFGKSECWYFHDLDQGAQVIHGWTDTPRLPLDPDEQVWLSKLSRVEPRQGSILFTPAGTVHALGPGILLYEIQQSSDLTYRLHDWGRGRELHLRESQEVLAADLQPVARQADELVGRLEVACPYFVVESVESTCQWSPGGRSFEILTLVAGVAVVGGENLETGDSLVIPADFQAVELDFKRPGRLLRIRP